MREDYFLFSPPGENTVVRSELESLVLKEPEPDIRFSHVFRLPRPVSMYNVKVNRARADLRRAQEARIELDHGAFEHAYNRLTALFNPLTDWLIACWDYLLTIEGPRFIERAGPERATLRGQYRGLELTDYQRLVFREFKAFMLEVDPEHFTPHLARTRLWPRVRQAFVDLEKPRDTRQRTLTAYSYLRCAPYTFLNSYHDQRVKGTLRKLPTNERNIIQAYFLYFFTPDAICRKNKISLKIFKSRLERGLQKLEKTDFLSYRLLLQISRY